MLSITKNCIWIIWKLGQKNLQLGLTSSILNVLVNIHTVQSVLSLSLSNTSTIVVSLKRRLEYKNAFQKGMVRPNIVMHALLDLTKTTLYKMKNVQINDKWI